MGNASVMVKQARLLGQTTSGLVNLLRHEAEEGNEDERRKLIGAAKLLADATAKMVEAAKGMFKSRDFLGSVSGNRERPLNNSTAVENF